MLAPPSPDRTVMAWIPAQGRDDGGGSRRAKALGLSRFSPLSQKLSPSSKPLLHSSPSPLIRGAPPEAFVGGAGSGACGGFTYEAPATEQSGAGWVRTPTPREAFATFVRRHYDRLWLWPTLRATGHSLKRLRPRRERQDGEAADPPAVHPEPGEQRRGAKNRRGGRSCERPKN